MTTKYLPRDHHIARHIKPRLIMWDEDTGEAVGVFPEAFALRDGEKDLSVSWLEFFPGSRQEQLAKVKEHTELTLNPRHGFSVLSVESFMETCVTQNAKVRIIHEPTAGNPAHSAVHRYPRDNAELRAVLANISGRTLTLVRELDRTSE